MEWQVGDGRTLGLERGSAALVASVGATHVFGSVTDTLAAIVPWARRDGFVVLGEGYWRQEPTDEWLAGLGAARDELSDRDAFLVAVERCGLHVEETVDATVTDIDRYNDEWRQNLERHLLVNPDDPDASEIASALDHARRWHPVGGDYLGFMIVAARVGGDS